MIRGFDDKQQFANELHSHLSPTTPIQSPEHLVGRTKQIQQIEQALYAPGRSIFIYGDRGVGKTSIALTVAYSHQSANRPPIMRACTPTTTFSSLIADVVDATADPRKAESGSTYKGKFGLNGPLGYGGSLELERSRREKPVAQPPTELDLNRAVSLLLKVSDSRKEDTVVVIDEFDRITDSAERTHFADFIKQIGDQSIPIRFIFCGVAESLDKLLGAHGSAYRYLESVNVRRLGHEARFEIIDRAAAAFKVKLEDRPRYRIAAISDGFPHYIHLVCEKLFWELFNDPVSVSIATSAHYHRAVTQSVSGIEPRLKASYEQAIMKAAEGFEDVLWAMADHADLVRKTEDVYNSYEKLFGDDPEKLDRQMVVSRLRALKGTSCGRILASERVGFYNFRESIMRGYVRLRAEDEGYELATDVTPSSSTSGTFRQRGARKSRGGVRRSDWRRTNIPTESD